MARAHPHSHAHRTARRRAPRESAHRAAGRRARCDRPRRRRRNRPARCSAAPRPHADRRIAARRGCRAHSLVGGRVRLRERVLGLPQRRTRRASRACRACACARSSRASSSRGCSAFRHPPAAIACEGGNPSRQAMTQPRVFQAEAFNALESAAQRSARRESPASAAGRRRRRCACRWRRSAGNARRDRGSAASLSSLAIGRCSAGAAADRWRARARRARPRT